MMELLVMYEELLEKEKGKSNSSLEEEGQILSDCGSSHEEDYQNQHTITRDSEMLTKHLNNLET